MATNNFKAFALAPNANVMSQAGWEALPALLSGFTAGKASSAQVNKAIRQSTTIAALVGQFIANSGVDALDNADVNGLVTKFTNALNKNLGLVGAPQAIGSTSGRLIIPAKSGGAGTTNFCIQWLPVSTGSNGTGTASFSLAFSSKPVFACAFEIGAIGSVWNGSRGTAWGVDFANTTEATVAFRAVTLTSGTVAATAASGAVLAMGYLS